MKKMIIAALLALSASMYATDTPTPTHTPTATPTPTPVVFRSGDARVIVLPNQVYANDGVVLASAQTTPQPGSAAPWLAQNVAATAFVMSTGAAKVRWSSVLPADYKRFLNVWAYASTTATAATMTMTLNVRRNAFGGATGNTATSKVFEGTATDMIASYPGFQEGATKIVRAKLPLNYSSDLKAGDLLSFDLQKSSGLDLYIYAIELEYDALTFRKP